MAPILAEPAGLWLLLLTPTFYGQLGDLLVVVLADLDASWPHRLVRREQPARRHRVWRVAIERVDQGLHEAPPPVVLGEGRIDHRLCLVLHGWFECSCLPYTVGPTKLPPTSTLPLHV